MAGAHAGTAAPPERYDVVIVGGGMVGAALACALGDGPLSVAVIERGTLAGCRPGDEPDLRVSAITPASRNLFDAVGAWRAMTGWRVGPYTDMHVWDSVGGGAIHFDCADLGEAALGWIIENRVIQHALLTRAVAFDNVTLLEAAALTGADFRPGAVSLALEDGRLLQAALLVGADGARSRIGALAGIDAIGWDYDQHALVCTVATEHPHAATAWQRFLPTGPVAFLPLHDGRCSIVWSTTPEEAARLRNLPEAEFEQALADALEYRLGSVRLMSNRAAFPLRLQHARRYVGPRVALVGDAAHTIHPLAGQGVNLGLMDAAALAECLLDGARRGRDPGSMTALRRYERWRKGHNVLVQGAMDALKRLFGSNLAPIRLARDIGLRVTDRATPVKNELARRAMGLSGDLPALARTVAHPPGNRTAVG
jgi:2-octaprenylphenol hydroxylase